MQNLDEKIMEKTHSTLVLLSVGLILGFYGRNKAFNQIIVIPKIYINNLSFFFKNRHSDEFYFVELFSMTPA